MHIAYFWKTDHMDLARTNIWFEIYLGVNIWPKIYGQPMTNTSLYLSVTTLYGHMSCRSGCARIKWIVGSKVYIFVNLTFELSNYKQSALFRSNNNHKSTWTFTYQDFDERGLQHEYVLQSYFGWVKLGSLGGFQHNLPMQSANRLAEHIDAVHRFIQLNQIPVQLQL